MSGNFIVPVERSLCIMMMMMIVIIVDCKNNTVM